MDLTIAGVSAVALTVALVEAAKRLLALDQRGTMLAALLIAQVLAVGSYAATRYPGFSDLWIAMVGGLLVAVTASGLYSGTKALAGK